MTNKPPDRLAYYEQYWKTDQIRASPHLRYKCELTRNHPDVKRCRALLDVGCGDGYVLDALGRRDARLAGVEVSSEAVARGKARGFDVRLVDLEQGALPFEAAIFDVVLCYDVLEHLFSPERVLAEIHRVLRPGGKAFLCVPNTLNAFNRLLFVLGEYVDVMDTSHASSDMFSNHIRLFSKALFERFIASQSFAVRERHYYFPDAFSDTRFPVPSSAARLFRATGLPRLMPTLFALEFLFVCERL